MLLPEQHFIFRLTHAFLTVHEVAAEIFAVHKYNSTLKLVKTEMIHSKDFRAIRKYNGA